MRRLYILLIIILFSTGIFSACENEVPEATATPTTSPTYEPTSTPLPTRMGAYLDNIYMFKTNSDYAAQQILDGSLDIFASGLRIDQLNALKDSSLSYDTAVKRQYELLLNPADTTDETGIINPFSYTEIRNSLNILIDREYITQEIFSRGAIPKHQPIIYGSGDYNNSLSAMEEIALSYQHDFNQAKDTITQVMLENECVINEDGIWSYDEKAVDIIVLIRSDDNLRTQIGDYVADQLERLSFQVTRRYASYSESNSLWAATDPSLGYWHIYTGRYTITSAELNQESVFADYYTSFGEYSELELYKWFETSEGFKESAKALQNGAYESTKQRSELITLLLTECNDYSYRIWLADEIYYFPLSESTELTNSDTTRTDLDYATVFTLNHTLEYGGELAWGSNLLLEDAINPVNGSIAYSETQYLNFTNLPLLYEDTDSGKKVPIFVDSAEITHLDTINIVNDADWISTRFAEEIIVPNDAIIAWDEQEDSAIYADDDYMHDAVGLATAWLATYERERPRDRDKISAQQEVVDGLQAIRERGYLTCNVMYSVQYSDSIFDLKWHDGSSFSIADIVMAHITKTQLMDEDSSLYDEYYAQLHAGELDGFKGFRVVSEKPLIIEYYTDDYSHLASETVQPMWVDYGSGQQSWAMAAAAQSAIKSNEASYSVGLSEYYGTTHLDYAKGESHEILEKHLALYKGAGYIPYPELLSKYITPTQAKEQYQNILAFYSDYNHLSIGLGIYMLTNVDALTPSLTLSAYSDFPIESNTLAEYFK